MSKPIDIFNTKRVELKIDDKTVMGFSIEGKIPENNEELIALLKEVLGLLEAPTVEDKDLLGERSPLNGKVL